MQIDKLVQAIIKARKAKGLDKEGDNIGAVLSGPVRDLTERSLKGKWVRLNLLLDETHKELEEIEVFVQSTITHSTLGKIESDNLKYRCINLDSFKIMIGTTDDSEIELSVWNINQQIEFIDFEFYLDNTRIL